MAKNICFMRCLSFLFICCCSQHPNFIYILNEWEKHLIITFRLPTQLQDIITNVMCTIPYLYCMGIRKMVMRMDFKWWRAHYRKLELIVVVRFSRREV